MKTLYNKYIFRWTETQKLLSLLSCANLCLCSLMWAWIMVDIESSSSQSEHANITIPWFGVYLFTEFRYITRFWTRRVLMAEYMMVGKIKHSKGISSLVFWFKSRQAPVLVCSDTGTKVQPFSQNPEYIVLPVGNISVLSTVQFDYSNRLNSI